MLDQLERNTIWVVLQESDMDVEVAARKLQVSIDELAARMTRLGLTGDPDQRLDDDQQATG